MVHGVYTNIRYHNIVIVVIILFGIMSNIDFQAVLFVNQKLRCWEKVSSTILNFTLSSKSYCVYVQSYFTHPL